MSNAERIQQAFTFQVGWSDGSPFMQELMRAAAADVAAGGVVAKLFADWTGDAVAGGVPVRLAGALHAAVLSGRAPALAKDYPAARKDWSMARIWPLAEAFLEQQFDWAHAFVQSAPQTNETRRAIALLPGFLELAKLGPLHTLEIGASAGLLGCWDRFRYNTGTWSWGEGDGPVIDTEWRGAPPAARDARAVVVSRAACDMSPIDLDDPAQVLRLKSYIWADQPDRMSRLDGAIALARRLKLHVERADAGEWLTARLAGALPEGVTVLYHSVMWQYLSAKTRAKAEAAIANAAARATPMRRFAWLRFEPNVVIGVDGPVDQMSTQLQLWPGGERRVLAHAQGHGRWVEQV